MPHSTYVSVHECAREHTCRQEPEVNLQCSSGATNFLILRQCLFLARNSPSLPAIPRVLPQLRGLCNHTATRTAISTAVLHFLRGF